jgi:hypothetical protein
MENSACEKGILSALRIAVVMSKTAVDLDEQNSHDSQVVVEAYKEAVKALGVVVDSCTKSHVVDESDQMQKERKRLISRIRSYECRIVAIENRGSLDVTSRLETITKVAPFEDLFDARVFVGRNGGTNEVFPPDHLFQSPESALSSSLKGAVQIRSVPDLSQTCWKLRAIHHSLSGGFLTSDVFVGPDIYFQSGARIIGLSLKIEVLEALNGNLLSFIEDTKQLSPPSVASPPADLNLALVSLSQLALRLSGLHDRLHRSFPSFVVERSVAPSVDSGSKSNATSKDDHVSAVPAMASQDVAPAAKIWGIAGMWGAAAGKAGLAAVRTAVAIGRSAAETSSEIASAAGETCRHSSI